MWFLEGNPSFVSFFICGVCGGKQNPLFEKHCMSFVSSLQQHFWHLIVSCGMGAHMRMKQWTRTTIRTSSAVYAQIIAAYYSLLYIQQNCTNSFKSTNNTVLPHQRLIFCKDIQFSVLFNEWVKCLCVHLFLCSGPQRLASWTLSVNWQPSWASASSSRLLASLKLYPSYLPLARLLQVVSLRRSCLKHEAKCCSKTDDQQWAAEHRWSLCMTTRARTSLRASALPVTHQDNRLPSPL